MLKILDIKKLYLIDPYKYDVTDESYTDNSELDHAEKIAKKRLLKYKEKIQFIRMTSSDALKLFADGTLDFVYIDGNHSYDYAKKDIETYYEKTKPRGILAGHDIENGIWYRKNGVTLAVFDFVSKNRLYPHIALQDWWIIKGEKRKSE